MIESMQPEVIENTRRHNLGEQTEASKHKKYEERAERNMALLESRLNASYQEERNRNKELSTALANADLALACGFQKVTNLISEGQAGSNAVLAAKSEIVELQSRLAKGTVDESQWQRRRVEDEVRLNT